MFCGDLTKWQGTCNWPSISTWPTSIDNFLDLLIGAISEVGESPAGVRQHLLVTVVHQAGQDGQDLTHGGHGRGRVLVTAQIGDGPGHIAQEGSLHGRNIGVWKNKLVELLPHLSGTNELTHSRAPETQRYEEVILQKYFSNSFYKLIFSFPAKSVWGEFHRTLLTTQYWFR